MSYDDVTGMTSGFYKKMTQYNRIASRCFQDGKLMLLHHCQRKEVIKLVLLITTKGKRR